MPLLLAEIVVAAFSQHRSPRYRSSSLCIVVSRHSKSAKTTWSMPAERSPACTRAMPSRSWSSTSVDARALRGTPRGRPGPCGARRPDGRRSRRAGGTRRSRRTTCAAWRPAGAEHGVHLAVHVEHHVREGQVVEVVEHLVVGERGEVEPTGRAAGTHRVDRVLRGPCDRRRASAPAGRGRASWCSRRGTPRRSPPRCAHRGAGWPRRAGSASSSARARTRDRWCARRP